MDTCYDGNLVMPEKFVVMNENETLNNYDKRYKILIDKNEIYFQLYGYRITTMYNFK